MCGICGELNFGSSVASVEAIKRMLPRLERRGPDHEGMYADGPLAFGHRRLSIIDLSAAADQPMMDHESQLVIVFNGTIYNYKRLRTELQQLGYHFFSHGDTEVILKAFHAWGSECVTRFNGMFAFAIWDLQKRVLFLARDRLGIKPLYYSESKNTFRFASNTQALLAAGGVDTNIDAVALHHQLTLHGVVPATHTILQGIRKIEPATTFTIFASGQKQIKRYWRLSAQRPPQEINEADWTKKIKDELVAAVKRRMEAADVPVGVLLSGGLDSSLLVGLLAESGAQDLRTFSVGFEDQPEESGNEFIYSDAVVQRFRTNHKRFSIKNSEVLKRLPEAVDQMAEPMVAQDAIAFYLLAEQVSKEVKVVQSGQGADEVFGGYFWYPQMASEHEPTVDTFAKYYFDRTHEEFTQTVTDKFVGSDATTDFVQKQFAQRGADTFIDAVFRMDVTTLIVDDPVKRVDNMTMAWGLEARVPFLDYELVELAMQLPPAYKLAQGGKYMLKKIARGLLPDIVIDREKGYFPVPALKYIRGPFLVFMRDILLSDTCRKRGLFQRGYIDKLLKNPEYYFTPLNGSKLWHLALLELWLQRNMDEIRVDYNLSGRL